MEEARQLLLKAYERARLSGKPEWNRMTTAVLKNRLIDVTGGTFNEADYGASNFTEFVSQNQSMLVLDRSVFPLLVELIEVKLLLRPYDDVASTEGSYRIRSDLWKAALDYSSGTRYVWDVASRQAIPAEGRDGELIISTTTESIQREWRKSFRTKVQETTTTEEADQIELWSSTIRGRSCTGYS